MYKKNKDSEKSMNELIDSIEENVKKFLESDKFGDYLRVMSKFHQYSVYNTILIASQMPEATLIAGYQSWKSNFSRNVKKGEKSIRIIAPIPYKLKKDVEKIDPRTQKTIKEEVEITVPKFRTVSVFDVSQTEGKPLPSLDVSLNGKMDQYNNFMEALQRSSTIPIAFEQMEGRKGYFNSKEQRIAIAEGMSEIENVSVAIHEIVHSRLHDYYEKLQQLTVNEIKSLPENERPKDKHTKEVEAESISYAVCSHYDIDTGEKSFPYIASWSKKDMPELKESLETIKQETTKLINKIDSNLEEILKEKTHNVTKERSHNSTSEDVDNQFQIIGDMGNLLKLDNPILNRPNKVLNAAPNENKVIHLKKYRRERELER